jgi:hypothetical protein
VNYLMNVEDKMYVFSNLVLTFQRNYLSLMNKSMKNLLVELVVQLMMLKEFQVNQEDLKQTNIKTNKNSDKSELSYDLLYI